MDHSTPNNNRTALPTISPLKDASVFDYINNLSPLDLVKPIGSFDLSAYNSLPISSPNIFASPPLASQRPYVVDLMKPKDDDASTVSNEENSEFSYSSNMDFAKSEFPIVVDDPKSVTDSPDKRVLVDKDRDHIHANETDLQTTDQFDQNDEEAINCDLISLVSQVADVLSFDSSSFEGSSDDMNAIDPSTDSFVSHVLETPSEFKQPVEKHTSSNINPVAPEQTEKHLPFCDYKEGNSVSTAHSVDKNRSNKDPAGERKNKDATKQKIRRRCLVFDMTGTLKIKSTLSSADTKANQLESAFCDQNQPFISRIGIGLHLNPLAIASQIGKENTALNSDCSENKDNTPELDLLEEFTIRSPDKKRSKPEIDGSCKHCNCRRSKCLKLYCECFAAGQYCIQPCSCQDCFNKPSHVDTVLETRKQIESRNPLAFAPKVVRTPHVAAESGHEDPKQTPASARHKRGCKCRKSTCLKKYCECFQEGVGCSSNCRCEGCKNSFGVKNALETSMEDADFMDETLTKTESTLKIQKNCSFSRENIIVSKFRQPKFETKLDIIPEDECADDIGDR